MSYAVPRYGSEAREAFELEDLVAIGYGDREPVLGIARARRLAREFFAGAHPAARRVYYFMLANNDELQLVSVGRRGGVKVEWRFGPYRIHKRKGV